MMERNGKFEGRFQRNGQFMRLLADHVKDYRFRLLVRDFTLPELRSQRLWPANVPLPENVKLRKSNYVITSTVMIRRSFLLSTGLLFNPLLVAGKEDFAFWKRVVAISEQPIRFISTPLGVYDTYEHGRPKLDI